MGLVPRRSVAFFIVVASLAIAPHRARAEAVVRDDFEGPEVSWRDGGGVPGYRMTRHQRVADGAHGGVGCEFFEFQPTNNGTFVNLQHALAPARVIPELAPTLWVRSDRTGVQLQARIVFPRSIDPKSGAPDAAIITGTSYSRAGNWEQLRITDLPALAAAQARVLRAETNRAVDAREAYIDRVVLNVFFSGAGSPRLWIDDLEVAGYAGLPPRAAVAESVPVGTPAPRSELTSIKNAQPAQPRLGPRLNGDLLLTGGRPFFPRAIEYQGEPLSFLRERGFNSVRLRKLPPPELLEEATKTGMWLICPPPLPPGLSAPQADMAPLTRFPPEFNCVLAWDLGEGLTGRELAAVKRWAEQVRRADPVTSRPILCGASAELHQYGSPAVADVLLLDRYITATSFELSEYRRWLRERPRFARYGTPIWSTVPTEPAPALSAQLSALSGGRPVDVLSGAEQTRLIAYTALGAGARALIFASHAPLTATDPATRWRAAQLELLNLEFDLLEPWVAGGKLTAAAESNDPDVLSAVLQMNGGYMVLPVWSGKGAQYVPGHTSLNGELLLRVPGVPETMSAYEVWPGGMRPLRTMRAAGGLRVTVDDFGLTSMILLTQDYAGEMLRRTIGARDRAERAARLTIETAKTKLQIDRAVRERLNGKQKALARGDEMLQTAAKELQEADSSLMVEKGSDAYRHAQFALRNMRAMERAYWIAATTGLPSPVGSPFAVAFVTLPQHLALVKNVDGARRGANLLPEGNFEDIGRPTNAGWKHFIHPQDRAGVKAEDARQSPAKKFEGKMSLRLAAAPSDPETPPDQVETPPAWITTRAVAVEPGTLLRLHARVLAPAPIKGSPDGLLIIDSLGGEALAERIRHATEWKELTAYRTADASGSVTITFALTGLGEVWIDDVSIEVVVPKEGGGAARFDQPVPPAATRPHPMLR